MLGVIFTGGESPSCGVIQNALKGKNAFFIAADSGLVAAEEAGVFPDLLIGDMDSVDAARLDSYPSDSVMRYERDKDYTDTELAFLTAVEKGCDEIWIIGGGGGRIDHLFGIRSLFEREIFPGRWITEAADIRCIDSGVRANTLSYCAERGSFVSVFPLCGGPWEAKSSGLKWPLEGLPWNRGFFGISNIAVDGDFSVTAKKGRFMVIVQGG